MGLKCPKHVIWVILTTVFIASSLHAEPPSWEDLRGDLFMTSKHRMDRTPEQDSYAGLWVFHPDEGGFTRIRPFYASRAHTQAVFWGDDGRLAVEGDRLIYQTWPDEYHFDAGSWRLVNRVPILNPQGSFGWALQGPILEALELEGTGLIPGTFGFAQCILDDISASHGLGPWPCDPLTLPEDLGQLHFSDNELLFFDEVRPSRLETLQFQTVFGQTLSNEAHVLSYDLGRQGFWRTDDGGTSFFPAEFGVIGPEAFRLEFGFDPFNTSLGAVISSEFHPMTDRIYTFGLRLKPDYSGYSERFFFSLDSASGEIEDITMPDLNQDAGVRFYPVSMTSFGPQPERYEQVVPIIAETTGRRGTFWTTDLWFYNPSPESTTVEVSRITTPDESMMLELSPFGSRRITNALAWVGGGAEGDGTTHDALHVVSDYRWGEQLVVAGKIWTADKNTGGAFGHVMTAVPYPWGYSNHARFLREDEEVYNVQSAGLSVSHVDLDLRESGKFRHNLGMVNSTDEPLSVEVLWGYNEADSTDYALHHPDGWRQAVTVEPHNVKVVDIKSLFPSDITETWPPRVAVLGSYPLPIWFSMVDEKTGDATFSPFSNYYYRSRDPWWEGVENFYRYVLPVAAHNRGREGSRWMTDLVGFVEGGGRPVDAVSPYFHPGKRATACNGVGLEGELYVDTIFGEFPSDLDAWVEELMRLGLAYLPEWAVFGWRTIFPDIVHSFPECAEDDNVFGGLELVTGSWFSGFSRTYTTRDDGGTYGSMLPLYPPGGWPVQHFAGLEISEATRINLGFFNGDHEHAITHRVTLFAADGTLTAEREFVLESLGSKLESIQDFFGSGVSDGTYGLTVMPLDDPDAGIEGRAWAYVSVIDQLTNDPINLW